jgi:hypothetical protein
MRSVVVNINPYSGGQRGPFSDGPWFNPDTTLLILWLIAPCLLSLGVKLRSSQPDTVLALLFLYWLAFVPLTVVACTLFRLLGFPMSA